MRITPRSVIKDGGQVYQPDVERDVPDETGRRFVILGWATSPDYIPPGVAPTPTTVDLTPHSATHHVTSTSPQGV